MMLGFVRVSSKSLYLWIYCTSHSLVSSTCVHEVCKCVHCIARLTQRCPWTAGIQFEMEGPKGPGSRRRQRGVRKHQYKNSLGKYLGVFAEHKQYHKWARWVQNKKEERLLVRGKWESYQREAQEGFTGDWESIPGFPGWPISAIPGNEYFED